LVDITDGSIGTASAIVATNIGSQNSASYTIAVCGASYDKQENRANSYSSYYCSKPVPGGYV
jgi:hypothetical protein